jgi:hypothetical protein
MKSIRKVMISMGGNYHANKTHKTQRRVPPLLVSNPVPPPWATFGHYLIGSRSRFLSMD